MTPLSNVERQLYQYVTGVVPSFTESLFEAIFTADSSNLAKLALGFPHHVEVVRRWRTENGYAESLMERANVLR